MIRREAEDNGLLFYWSIESWFLWHMKDAMNYRGLMILWSFPRLLNQRCHEGGGGEGNYFSAADGNSYRHLAVSHGGGRWNKVITG